jgi:UDP-N-acetylmuramoyl-tripeptide--D-alanyl-D-alanine ligase
VVEDSVLGLGRLAHGYLDRLDAVVVAVTGSSGKTSTKDLLAALLAGLGPTVAPEGSFNTEIGVPLTVLRADETTRFLALEYSARGIGHIAYLCGIARPRLGVVLNVGQAHLGEFGSREAIAKAKGELVEALPSDGCAVLNADDPLVAAMSVRTPARVVTFGLQADADVRASKVSLDELARPSFRLHAGGQTIECRLAVHGVHQVSNALAAATVALELGMPLEQVAATLATARIGSRWRMEVRTGPNGLTVINDSYNANPDSMHAAVTALAAMSQAGHRRSWAVLGEMAELGSYAASAHVDVGEAVAMAGIDRLVVVGVAASGLADGAIAAGMAAGTVTTVPDVDAAVSLLREQLRADDVVLVKASRVAELQRVAHRLLEPDELRTGA